MAPRDHVRGTRKWYVLTINRDLGASQLTSVSIAGLPMEQVTGSKTSVFIGNFLQEYKTLLSRDPQMAQKYKATGTALSMLANRLSWFYNFTGPSISLDTACSSSLNALHLACQSLRCGESTMVILAVCCWDIR